MRDRTFYRSHNERRDTLYLQDGTVYRYACALMRHHHNFDRSRLVAGWDPPLIRDKRTARAMARAAARSS